METKTLKKSEILSNMATILFNVERFASGAFARNESVGLGELCSLGCIAANDDEIAAIRGANAPFSGSPLEFASLMMETHLAITLNDTGDFGGSLLDIALGNVAYAICLENGVRLDDEDAERYCLKATQEEILRYNLGRIAAANP